jgi:hypothetical protein
MLSDGPMKPCFRRYLSRDRGDCLRVFSSNVPRYFREHERAGFETFLDSSGCPYFVVELSGAIVGCGGYGVREPGALADLCWGMIDVDHQRNHLGEFVLLSRLHTIVMDERAPGVRLATSQLTDGFFQRYGFTVLSRSRNGIGEGLDEVEMRLDLTEDAQEWILHRWHQISSDNNTMHAEPPTEPFSNAWSLGGG